MTTLDALKILLLKLSILLLAQASPQPYMHLSPGATIPFSGTSEIASSTSPLVGIPAIPPVLYRVAACESTGNPNGTPRQFNDDGSPLWGNDPKLKGATTTDVGTFQISLNWHRDEIRQLGLDVVYSKHDNITYALLLYRRYGLQPWSASKNCWQQ